jgi:hypothetical protein
MALGHGSDDGTTDPLHALFGVERLICGRLVSRGLILGSRRQQHLQYLGPDGSTLLLCARAYNLFGIVALFVATALLVTLPESLKPITDVAYGLAGVFVLCALARSLGARRLGKRWRAAHLL